MNNKLMVPTFLILSAALFACDRVGSHEEAEHADVAAEAKAVQQAEAQMFAGFKARDAAKASSVYAEDALLATPEQTPVKGRQAIGEMFARDFKDPAFSLDLTNEKTDVAASGDLAYTRGTFRIAFTNPGTKKVENGAGTYLTVFRKQEDGSWKVTEDLATPGG